MENKTGCFIRPKIKIAVVPVTRLTLRLGLNIKKIGGI
jgi:hypothetical protein